MYNTVTRQEPSKGADICINGIPDVVEDGKTGFLVPASDERALAASVNILHSELRNRMGHAGQNQVTKFDLGSRIGELVDICRLLSNQEASRSQ
jgi:glycosyltransferase involved in cell wall biosynthesis